jgi:cell division protein FtsQ
MLSVLVLLVIFLLLWKNNTFVLKAVRIYNNQLVTKNEILQTTVLDFSADIFKINIGRIERDILKHPMIEEVKITRYYPSILNIRVKEHALIAGISGSEVAVVTEKGNLIFKYNPDVLYDLPIITGIHFETDTLGNRQPQNPELMKKSIKIFQAIKKKDPLLFHEISELNFSQNKGMVFFLKKNNIPVIFGKNNLIRKLNYFSTIFNKLSEKKLLNNALALDIRYEGQVVVKQK